MLDLKAIREDPDRFRARLTRRGAAEDLDRLIAFDREQRELKTRVEQLRAEQNRASKDMSRASAEERASLVEQARRLTADLKALEPDLERVTEEMDALLARLPNVPHESVPDGESDDDNVVERTVGEPARFDFEIRDHVELGERLGLLDLERAARTSGSRFAYLLGPSVWLQWALVRYALDVLSARAFTPVIPPVLVREEAMYGTGFLPTDEAQIYVTR